MTTGPKSQSEFSQLLQATSPFFQKYGQKLILALAAVLLIVAAVVFWTRTSNATAAAGWGDMQEALAGRASAGAFADIADDHPGKPVATWARIQEAERRVNTAISLSFSNRPAAKREFKDAREVLDDLLSTGSTPPNVRQRALLAMARVEEANVGADTSAAVAAYQKIVDEFPGAAVAQAAEKRITRLKDEKTKSFYEWFQAQNPQPGDDLNLPNDVPETPGDPEKMPKFDLTPDDEKPGEPKAPEQSTDGGSGDNENSTNATDSKADGATDPKADNVKDDPPSENGENSGEAAGPGDEKKDGKPDGE